MVEVDSQYFRPAEVDFLLGDNSKAKKELGREPQYTVQEMCKEMVEEDRDLFRQQALLKEHGYSVLHKHE